MREVKEDWMVDAIHWENTGKRCIVQSVCVCGTVGSAENNEFNCEHQKSLNTFQVPILCQGLCRVLGSQWQTRLRRSQDRWNASNKVNESKGNGDGGGAGWHSGSDSLERALKSKDRPEPINCKYEWEHPQKTCTVEWEHRWTKVGTRSNTSVLSRAEEARHQEGTVRCRKRNNRAQITVARKGAEGIITHLETILPLDLLRRMTFFYLEVTKF